MVFVFLQYCIIYIYIYIYFFFFYIFFFFFFFSFSKIYSPRFFNVSLLIKFC
jgi:hypothetical protein